MIKLGQLRLGLKPLISQSGRHRIYGCHSVARGYWCGNRPCGFDDFDSGVELSGAVSGAAALDDCVDGAELGCSGAVDVEAFALGEVLGDRELTGENITSGFVNSGWSAGATPLEIVFPILSS